MTDVALQVEQAGPSSTLQDGGRFGYLARGVSPAGPFDRLLHAIANRLVGNDAGCAAIEFTLKGDTYRVQAERCRIAVTGDFDVRIDGEKAGAWRTHTLRRGQALAIGNCRPGLRGYLAVAGGFDLPQVLGSLSVHTRTGIGPLNGTVLKQGSVLPLKSPEPPRGPDLRIDPKQLPGMPPRLRVVLGPQQHYFSDEAIAAFLNTPFVLAAECDRMGFQVKGPDIPFRRDIPLISEGVALGSVQVLDKGLFIINLVDRQTVGGYPKIATVISSDIRALAQLRPGSTIQFEAVDIAQAQAIHQRERMFIGQLDSLFRPANAEDLTSEQLLEGNLISGVLFAE